MITSAVNRGLLMWSQVPCLLRQPELPSLPERLPMVWLAPASQSWLWLLWLPLLLILMTLLVLKVRGQQRQVPDSSSVPRTALTELAEPHFVLPELSVPAQARYCGLGLVFAARPRH